MRANKVANNWYVITGASCAGKTTLIRELEKKGYDVVHEIARTYIDERIARGETIENIRRDEVLFQKNVLKKKIEIENKLPKKRLIFFDRGIPDTYAYDKLNAVKSNLLLKKAFEKCSYKKIFLLGQLPFIKDYARTETEQQQKKLHKWLEKGYKILGFTVVKVPIFPIEREIAIKKRVSFVLDNL